MEQRQPSGNVFDEMGEFWAEIADSDQTQRQINFLEQHLPRDTHILDVACGTGRHMTPLADAGFNLIGLDFSKSLLHIAKQHGAEQLVRGDIRFLPFKSGTFGAAVSMDTSFGYLPTQKDDIESLVELKRVLADGGEFAIDVFNREYLTAKYRVGESFPKWREYPSFSLLQKRTIIEGGEKLRDLWTIRTKSGQVSVYEHVVRLYQPQNLIELLTDAGFTVKTTYGDYENQPHSSVTPRLIILSSAN